MENFLATVAATKPQNRARALQLAAHSDHLTMDVAKGVPGLSQHHVDIAGEVFKDSKHFRETMIIHTNTIILQARIAAKNLGSSIEDCRRGEHAWVSVPSGQMSHISRAQISQTFSHSTTDSQSSKSFALGPLGYGRNSNSSMQSNNGQVSAIFFGGETYQLQDKCVICGQTGQVVPVSNCQTQALGHGYSAQTSMEEIAQVLVKDSQERNPHNKH